MSQRIEEMSFGQFLFLFLLGKNVDYFVYKAILDMVNKTAPEEDAGTGLGYEEESYPIERRTPGSFEKQMSAVGCRDSCDGEIGCSNSSRAAAAACAAPPNAPPPCYDSNCSTLRCRAGSTSFGKEKE